MNNLLLRSKVLCLALFCWTFLFLNSTRLNAQVVDCEVISSPAEIDTNLIVIASIPQKLNIGRRICIPFTINTFEYIISTELELSYNSSEMSFITFNSGNCLTDLIFNEEYPGLINILYFDANPVCCEDGSVLFELCFDVNNDIFATSSLVAISSNQINYAIDIFSNDYINAQTELIIQSSEISINDTECLTDNLYNATFTIPNDSLNYDIYINDQLDGNYIVNNMSITLDSITGSGNSKDVFKFCQNGLDSCCIELIVFNPCICGFADITSAITDCNESDSTYFITLDFVPQNNGNQFVIGGNGNTYGTFNYSDLPVTLGPLPADDTEYEFIFFDSDDALCFEFIEVGIVDCEEINACIISDVVVEATDCDMDGNFYVHLEFEVVNPGNDGFTVQGNGMNYGNFDYGESFYEIGPLLGDCETIYEFIIIDIQEQDCESDFGGLSGVVCCDIPECVLSELSFEQICEPNLSYFLDFDYVDISSDEFDLYIDDILIGTYNYTDLPITSDLGQPQFMDSFITVEVVDSENEDCSTIQDNIEVGCVPDCENSELFVEAHPCDGEVFYIDFEFETNQDTVAEGFVFYVNDMVYESYTYGETFYTAGPFNGDCSTLYTFSIVDQLNEDCGSSYAITEPICCDTIVDCIISDISVELLECDAEQMSFMLNFNHSGTVNDFFDVTSRDGYFDSFLYSDLPITITGYPNTGNVEEFIEICDNDNPVECCAAWEWNVEECKTDTVECKLYELNVELIECDTASMVIIIDFDYEGTTNTFLDVYSREGYFDSYSFTDLPLTISEFPNTGNDFEFIKVCENDNNNCCVEAEWLIEECNGSISNENIYLENLSHSIHNNELIFTETFNDIRLYNTIGQQIRSSSNSMISISGISAGIYIVSIANDHIIASIKVYIP